jgi:hypothetical protein
VEITASHELAVSPDPERPGFARFESVIASHDPATTKLDVRRFRIRPRHPSPEMLAALAYNADERLRVVKAPASQFDKVRVVGGKIAHSKLLLATVGLPTEFR